MSKVGKSRLIKLFNHQLDNLFINPKSKSSIELKKSILDKSDGFLTKLCENNDDVYDINTKVIDCDHDHIRIDISMRMLRPIKRVNMIINKPDSMTGDQFTMMLEGTEEEIKSNYE